jgi:deoxycytidylate deaminase
MMKKTPASQALPGLDTEIVLGIVGAVGTDLDLIERSVSDYIKSFGYVPNVLRVSSFLKQIDVSGLGVKLFKAPEARRINSSMDAGNAIRSFSKDDGFLAYYAASLIQKLRGSAGRTLGKTIHIVRSLKHPKEVEALRKIYGPGFFLLGVYTSVEDRLEYLLRLGVSQDDARRLLRRDEEEAHSFGQKTQDTFHLSDAFVHLESRSPGRARAQIERFIDLLFGNPFHTPTQDEHAMFLAFSSALRSGDLSRQVGAVVTSLRGEVIAAGSNEVPCFGGGQYWPGEHDHRDLMKGFDSNARRKNEILLDIMRRIKSDAKRSDSGFLRKASNEETLLKEGMRILDGSPLFDLTEFGRAVHAEMEALLSCARNGISTRDTTVYTTTFPCHNCAKHIVASGVSRVVYVEPYPKSLAKELHSDSIGFDQFAGKRRRSGDIARKVQFEPFVGIGPRRYFDLFSLNLGSGTVLKRKIDGKNVRPWARDSAKPRIPMLSGSYMQRETLATARIKELTGEEDAPKAKTRN